MKKYLFLLLLIPALVFPQKSFRGSGGSGGVSVSSLLPIIADSSKWTAGSHVHAIKPRGGKSVQADTIKAGYLNVTGNTQLDGNLTMNTIATEQVKLGTGSDAAPELSSTGDTNTGMRLPGGDKMQFVQNGLNSHTFRPYRYTMTYSDGDTFGVSLNGSTTNFNSNVSYYIYSGTNYVAFNGTSFFGAADGRTLGHAGKEWNAASISDNLYLGGKGQTATQYISGENTIAGDDSSWAISAASGVPTLTAKFSLPAASYSNGGRRVYMGADSVLFNFARTGRDSSWALQTDGNVRNNNIITIKRTVSLADQAEYTPQIPAGMCGWGSVQIGDDVEWARFRFKADGTVTLEANSTNVSTTNDTDEKLNIYDAGTTGIIIENQLGSTLTAAFVIECHLP